MKWLALLLLLFCVGCELDGTDTGNPGIHEDFPQNGDTPVSGIVQSTVSDLVSIYCSGLRDCSGKAVDDCEENVLRQDNIHPKLGLAEEDFANLEEVDIAIANNEITPDLEVTKTCGDDFTISSCADFTASYDEDAVNPFAGIADMIPSSCQGVFGVED